AGLAKLVPVLIESLHQSPAADKDLSLGKLGPQPLAEITGLAQAARRQRADANQSGALALRSRDEFGRKHFRRRDFDIPSRWIEQLTKHLKGQLVGLVAGRTAEHAQLSRPRRLTVDGRSRFRLRRSRRDDSLAKFCNDSPRRLQNELLVV